jgi:hypothetical protein
MTALEAVAKAICCPDGCLYPELPEACCSFLRTETATAAIAAYKAAIREPTQEMMAAGDKAADHDGENIRGIFQAMLDKAEG